LALSLPVAVTVASLMRRQPAPAAERTSETVPLPNAFAVASSSVQQLPSKQLLGSRVLLPAVAPTEPLAAGGSYARRSKAAKTVAARHKRGSFTAAGDGEGSSLIAGGLRWASAACLLSCRSVAVRRSRERQARICRGSGVSEENCEQFQVYPQRWVQLALLALLAMISDLVCFSVAAIPGTWKSTFGEDPAILLDIFLFTNVASCFVEPTIVKKFGLRGPIVAAAALMAAGCLVRSGDPFSDLGLPDYTSMVVGTILVGAAQPFFQCTPPLLSATWFAPSERALSTAVAINFNQVGIAAAFLLGGELALNASGLKQYFNLISVLAIVVLVASVLAFQERPATAPSASELEKWENESSEDDFSFPDQAMQLLQTPGFLQPLAAFVCSIMVTNVIGAFMEGRLVAAGIADQRTVDLTGAGFEFAIVLGGIVLGGIVDQNKEYKSITLGCLVATLVALSLYGLGMAPPVVVIGSLLAVGSLAGPVQPINAELAVEATYPSDENSIEAVQQLCGNLASALLVPVCAWAAGYTVPLPFLPSDSKGAGLGGDTAILMALVLFTTGYFSTFSGRLRRTETDEQCVIPEEEKERELEQARFELEKAAEMDVVEVDAGRRKE